MAGNQEKRHVAIYSRKSKFTGKGESIENQIELCRQYIAIHFPEIGEDDIYIYEDEGFSEGNTHRPQFMNMMKMVRAGKIREIEKFRMLTFMPRIGKPNVLDNIGIMGMNLIDAELLLYKRQKAQRIMLSPLNCQH